MPCSSLGEIKGSVSLPDILGFLSFCRPELLVVVSKSFVPLPNPFPPLYARHGLFFLSSSLGLFHSVRTKLLPPNRKAFCLLPPFFLHPPLFFGLQFHDKKRHSFLLFPPSLLGFPGSGCLGFSRWVLM